MKEYRAIPQGYMTVGQLAKKACTTVRTLQYYDKDSGIDDGIRETVEKTVRELVPFDEVVLTHAGCTVSSHCGPGTLGILFYRK